MTMFHLIWKTQKNVNFEKMNVEITGNGLSLHLGQVSLWISPIVHQMGTYMSISNCHFTEDRKYPVGTSSVCTSY